MVGSTCKDLGVVHKLRFLMHEDEAEIIGMSFEVVGLDAIKVSKVFSCDEYNDAWSNPTVMTRDEARKTWKKMLEDFMWSDGESWIDPKTKKGRFTPAPNATKIPLWEIARGL